MREPIDVEALLRWAYREELVKRITSSAEAMWDRIDGWQQLSAAVDYGTRAPQRYDLGVPHADALRIEQGVALLADAVVDWQREAYSVLGHLLALADPREKNNAPAIAPRATRASWYSRNGTKVAVQLEPPRDVLLVRSLRTSALVIMHARMGTRPDWIVEPPRAYAVPALRGTGPAIVGECRGRNWYSTGSYCPLVWEPSPIAIAQARADYLAWWRGLVALRELLQLDRFVPTGPSASEYPWRVSRETMANRMRASA